MKSISFQRNKSLIRVVNEKQGKQKNNWDRIIYLALLCLFVLLLTYYVFVKLFFIHANGHVIIETACPTKRPNLNNKVLIKPLLINAAAPGWNIPNK